MTVWSTARLVFIYPVLFILGILWFHLFVLRWRQCHLAKSALWAATLGLAVAIWAATGFVGIWLIKTTNTTGITTILFTLGSVVVAVVMATGVVWIIKHTQIRVRRDESERNRSSCADQERRNLD